MSDINYLIVYRDLPFPVVGPAGGAEIATRALARFLARTGSRVFLAAQLEGAETEQDGVQYWDLGPDYEVAGALERAAAQGPYHLIAVNRALPLLLARSQPECRSLIFMAHDRQASDAGLALKTLGFIADVVLCLSQAQRQELIKGGLAESKAQVIYNGVDPELFRPDPSVPRDWHKLVFSGALVPDKGLHLLLQIYGELKQRFPRLSLDVYGSAALWQRSEYLNHQELAEQLPGLCFKGSVPQPELARAFQGAGLCIFPSLWFETCPLTVVEAQACGCPVIAAPVGGVPELLVAGESGMLLPEISAAALGQAITQTLSDPAKQQRWSQQAAALVPSKFNWEKTAAAVAAVAAGLAVDRAGTPELDRRPVGFLSTWNQECGLAEYGRALLSELAPGSYWVLAEDVPPDQHSEDEDFVERCWRRDSGDFSRLRAAIEKHNIGLLHLNCQARFFKQPDFAQFLTELRSQGVKVLAQFHSSFTWDSALQALVATVDAVLVHTPENRLELIAHGAAPERVFVIPLGVTVRPPLTLEQRQRARRELGLPLGQPVICAFGFLQAHKGMEGVLEIVAQLSRSGTAAVGCLVGKTNPSDPHSAAYLEKLKGYAAELGISGQIHFLNRYVPEAEALKYIQVSDLVLMNYQSRYYESSAAGLMALGAGALVAASLAPAFQSLGAAVWHLTAGYPPALAAELLLSNESLRESILANARRYCAEHSWPKIARHFLSLYQEMGFRPQSAAEERKMEKNFCVNDGRPGMRVLMQNRPNACRQPGGDTVVMEQLSTRLRPQGVDLVIDLEGREDPASFDLVHLFNFAVPGLLRAQAERAHQAGVPYVVTTLCEDVPQFFNQMQAYGQALIAYVQSGQSASWWEENRPDLRAIPASAHFDNEWVARHAAALFANGAGETRALQRCYPGLANVREIRLGHELPESGEAADFSAAYGVKDFVLCVGRLETRKNQLLLLKALAEVELPVVLAAGAFSYQPEYAAAVRRFRRRGQTVVVDRLSAPLLAGAYRAARVHALASWHELPGLVSLEAAHYGCQVVAAENGTAPDYLGPYAYYCNPADEHSIRNAVLAAYYAPCQSKLKELVMTYTWNKTAEDTLAAYQKILGLQPMAEARPAQVTIDLAGYDMAAGSTEFQETLERGELAARGRDYSLAQDYLERALGMNPRSGRTRRAMGAVLLAQGRAGEAQPHLLAAHEIDPNDPKTLSGLGMCEMQSGAAATAYEYFLKALDRDGDHTVTLLQFVECCYVVQRFDDLIAVLRRFVRAHPEDINIKYCLAGAHYKQGDIPAALRTAREVLAVSPNHLGAKQLVEMISEDETLSGPSTALAESAVSAVAPAAAPEYDDIDGRLAELDEHKRRKEYEPLRAGCQKLLLAPDLRPDQIARAKVLMAELAVLEGRLAEADFLYSDLLRLHPRMVRALTGQGALAASREQWTEARRLFETALAITADYDVALAGMGLVSAWEGRSEQAWDYYQAALRSNPENTRALLGALEIGYATGKLAEIERTIRTYLELHPGDLEFVYALAGCCYAQNKLSEAQEEVNKITLFEPQNPRALELRELIAQRQ